MDEIILMGVDPGKTTGVFIARLTGLRPLALKKINSFEIKTDFVSFSDIEKMYYEFVEIEKDKNHVLIVEDFRIRPNSPGTGNIDYSSQIIGVLKFLSKGSLVIQQPSERMNQMAKNIFGHENSKHVRDACGHVVAFSMKKARRAQNGSHR